MEEPSSLGPRRLTKSRGSWSSSASRSQSTSSPLKAPWHRTSSPVSASRRNAASRASSQRLRWSQSTYSRFSSCSIRRSGWRRSRLFSIGTSSSLVSMTPKTMISLMGLLSRRWMITLSTRWRSTGTGFTRRLLRGDGKRGSNCYWSKRSYSHKRRKRRWSPGTPSRRRTARSPRKSTDE